VTPQPGPNDKFYCTVYYMTLNSKHEAYRVSKNLKKDCRRQSLKPKLMLG
jgi:hypothetical protein